MLTYHVLTEPQSLDLPYLQDECEKLRDLLQGYSISKLDAGICLRDLALLSDHIESGQISVPNRGVAPCGYYFFEGSLSGIPKLVDAFAKFSLALQCLNPLKLKALLDKSRTACLWGLGRNDVTPICRSGIELE